MLRETEAFALRRYVTTSGEVNLNALERDVVSLAREASVESPAKDRIVATVEALWKGKVVQGRLDKNKDVLENYSKNTPLEEAESVPGQIFKEAVLSWNDGDVGIWISSPRDPKDDFDGTDFYQEGRLRIVIKKTKLGIPLIKTYGIPLVGVTPDDCLYQFWRLEEFSEQRLSVDKPRDLRANTLRLKIPEGSSWIDFLQGQVSTKLVNEEVWDAIRNGEVATQTRQIAISFRDKVIDEQKKERIRRAVKAENYSQLIYIGAEIEREMAKAGFKITAGVCGLLNSDLIKPLLGYANKNRSGEWMGGVDGRCWEYKLGDCRICNSKTEVGPCKICRNCEKLFDNDQR